MANFSGTLNLLGFKGARVFSNLDAQHPNQLFVAIPVNWNEIQLSQDGKYANAHVYMAETGENFRRACIQRKQQSGDDMTGYLPPSHQMEVSFSQDFRQRALEAARQRLLKEHPEWTGADLENPDKNSELRNAMYDAVRCRLGTMYCHQRPATSQTAPASAQAANGAQGWNPQNGDTFPPQDDDADGLPF